MNIDLGTTNMSETQNSLGLSNLLACIVMQHPCLYDPLNIYYKDKTKKNEALEFLTSYINNKLKTSYKTTDILRRWDNIRKKYVHHKNTGTKYYLESKLKWIDPFIHIKDKDNVVPSSIEQNQTESKNILMDSTNSCRNRIIPTPHINYKGKKCEIDLLEKKSVEVADLALKEINKLVTSEVNYGDYLDGIQEALYQIDEENILDCVNGILDIISNFL